MGVMGVTVISLVCELDPALGERGASGGPWSIVFTAPAIMQASALSSHGTVCSLPLPSPYLLNIPLKPPIPVLQIEPVVLTGSKIQISHP